MRKISGAGCREISGTCWFGSEHGIAFEPAGRHAADAARTVGLDGPAPLFDPHGLAGHTRPGRRGSGPRGPGRRGGGTSGPGHGTGIWSRRRRSLGCRGRPAVCRRGFTARRPAGSPRDSRPRSRELPEDARPKRRAPGFLLMPVRRAVAGTPRAAQAVTAARRGHSRRRVDRRLRRLVSPMEDAAPLSRYAVTYCAEFPLRAAADVRRAGVRDAVSPRPRCPSMRRPDASRMAVRRRCRRLRAQPSKTCGSAISPDLRRGRAGFVRSGEVLHRPLHARRAAAA